MGGRANRTRGEIIVDRKTSDRHGGTTRGTFIVILLLSTLLLAGALAYQAMDSVASHRATANAVLEDYAAFAAEQYAGRVTQQLEYYGIRPSLQRLAVLHIVSGQSNVPTRAAMERDADASLRQSLEMVRYLFRFNPETGDIVSAAGEEASPPSWLGVQLASHVEQTGDTTASVHVAFLGDGTDSRPFAYLIYRNNDTTAPTGYGFEANTEALTAHFRTAFSQSPILPATLTRGMSYDSVLTVRVRHGDGTEFVKLTDAPQPLRYGQIANHPLPDRLAGLSVEVSLDPAAAEMLVIGGLPYSKLPFILGLFALTAGLIVAALLQFRREQELDRLRSEFVSNISHELRTPLAQLRMFAETLLLGRIRSDEEHQRSLSIIDKETRRLAHLVENMLLFSRSERSTVTLEHQKVALQPLLGEIVDSFMPLAAAQQCTVSLTADPLVLQGDPGAIRQIVLNLLDNAVKYGPPGQRIELKAELHDGKARIAVEDEGPGIPESDRTKVWERFGRLERERASSVAGAGIGLAVVSELTELHNGRAWVESSSSGGARFIIELPDARVVRRQQDHDATPPPSIAQPAGRRTD